MTQEEKIIDYMERHGSITPLEAMEEFGIMRLGAPSTTSRKAA